MVLLDSVWFSQRTGRRLSKPEVDATFREFDQNKVNWIKSRFVFTESIKTFSVPGQQVELQRVLRDDEPKEATINLRQPGGEIEEQMHCHLCALW